MNLNPIELTIGMALNDDKRRSDLKKYFQRAKFFDHRHQKLAESIIADDFSFEKVFRDHGKEIAAYAIALANAVESMDQDKVADTIHEYTSIEDNLVNYLPEDQKKHVNTQTYKVLVEKIAAFCRETNPQKRAERKLEMTHAKECFEHLCRD